MDKRKLLKNTPFFILVIIVLYTLITGIAMNKFFSWNIYAGIISVMICFIAYFFKYKWFNYLFFITLVVGCFNILHFTFKEVTISFSLGLFKSINIRTINIQLLSFSILILFVIIKRKRISELIKGVLYVPEEKKKENEEARIKSFEKKYSTMSQSELKIILENKESYTVEAVKAAQRLLETK